MKKPLKYILWVFAFLATTAYINKTIFSLASKKNNKNSCDKFYTWKHGKIRYVVKGEGKPILLVHDIETGASIFEWAETIEKLSAHYKVYAIDLLGFGQSDKSNISYSAYLYVILINDFIRDVIGNKTFFVGRGLSASYGIMAYYFEPSIYKKMVLIAPKGVGNTCKMPKHRNVWLRWLLEAPIIGTAIYNILSSHFYLKWYFEEYYYNKEEEFASSIIKNAYYSAHNGGRSNKYPISSLLNNYLNVSIDHVLPQVNIPLHIVWGDNNVLNPITNFQQFEKLNPSITLSIFENEKLIPNKTKPYMFSKICSQFFGN